MGDPAGRMWMSPADIDTRPQEPAFPRVSLLFQSGPYYPIGPRMYGECGFPTWLGMLNISVYSASFILRRDIQTQKHILRACRELSRRKKTSYRRNFKFSDFSVRREGASDTLYPTEVLAQDGPGRVVPVARSLSQSPVAGSFGGFAGSTSMF